MIDLPNANSPINSELLKEISGAEYPLLVDFKEKAPGTFQHSEHVAHLCEKIGVALKLSCDFLRVVGLYHDLGKILNPEYFCENQPKDCNIHDGLDPLVSAHYLISHVAGTVALLIDHIPGIPMEILRCVSTHHGDMVLRSMINKVEESQREVVLKKFTYPHRRPYDVYSGVLMICDTVEATLKSLLGNGKIKPEEVSDKIREIISNLTAQQQLDELTFKQGRIITDVLVGEYDALDHKRIAADYGE